MRFGVTDLVEEIGPLLGVVAFVGLAVLAFLIFQQAREVRRLREWAGRAPERAEEAVEASLAAAEARGEADAGQEEAERGPGRFSRARDRVRGWVEPRYAALDRRMPVDPRYLLVVLAAGVIAAGVLTSGFGVFDDEAGGGGGGKRGGGGGTGGRPEVTVLNATQVEAADGTEIQGVPMLAAKVADQVVRPAGYEVARTDDAASGVEQTVVMYEPGGESDAERLAERVSDQLGPTETAPIVAEVADLAGDAPIVLVVGLDDEDF
jgi:hypothetical protein